MYKIRGGDQREYGPVSIDVMKGWIAEKRVNADTLVLPEGTSDWRPLAEFREFRADLLNVVASGSRSPAAARAGKSITTTGQPSTALATISLIFGIFGIAPCLLFSGVPAIITGHLAHHRARKDPARYGGRRLALAGFILGYLSLVSTFVAAGIILPTLARMRFAAGGFGGGGGCYQRVRAITMSSHHYANENNDLLPTDFSSLTNFYVTAGTFHCPSDKKRTPAQTWESLTSSNITYELVTPGMKLGDAPLGTVIVRCPVHGHAGFADGSVQRGTNQTSSPSR